MQGLEKRIAALEQKDPRNGTPTIWLLRFVGMAETQRLYRIRHKGREWNILPGESEDAFAARVKAEAFPGEGEAGVILLAD